MWTLDPLSSMADVLDSLSNGEWWTVTGLCDDTGRTRRTISGVCSTLTDNGLITKRRVAGGTRKQVEFQIRTSGRLWLWACGYQLPPREIDYVIGLLDILQEAGPIRTTVLYRTEGLKEHKTRKAIRMLRALGYVRWIPLGWNQWRIEITGPGLVVLGSWKRLQDAAHRL